MSIFVSVIYCTARHGGIDILEKSMEQQTYKNFEVIIVDELKRGLPCSNTIYKHVSPPPKKPSMFWNLSASLNAGVRVATGDLIILLQDYVWVPLDGIDKFVKRFEQEPRGIITGVGNQYEPSLINIDLNGKYSVWNDGFPGPPGGEMTFQDPRTVGRSGFFLCTPVEWEANWGSFPKQAWLDVGGFDEDFDAGWGYDNVNFAERCQFSDYHIFLDCDNEVKCYSHINLFNEQKKRDSSPNNQALWYKKYREISRKQAPWKLNYC